MNYAKNKILNLLSKSPGELISCLCFISLTRDTICLTELTTIQCNFVLTIYIALLTDGAEHQDELEVDGVPPYEDRLGPDG